MDSRFNILIEYAVKVSSERDPDKLLVILADLARDILKADRCSLFLLDRERNVLWTKVAHGIEKIEVEANKGVVGWVVKNGKPLIVKDPYKDPRFNPDVDIKTGYRTKNILCVPIFDKKGEVMGAFEAINKLGRKNFTKTDMKIFELIASYAGSVIETSLLEKQIKEAYKETILRLSHAAEYKDKETYNHIIRVGLYAEIMGRGLGLEEEVCKNLAVAAPLHDVGKIGIPDAILLKPGPLTEEEWEIMKKHTIIGYEILKGSKSELLQMAALIALEHHEKWDGSGYPYGKKGKEISLWGRITAIADVCDALLSKRPYKDAWNSEKVYEYLKGQSGKHFDPEILNIFLKNYDEVLRIKEEYKDEV